MLQIYNSLTRKKEVFVPIEPGKVRMYVCGMTVYDYCHLGHARVMVVFDVVARYLRAKGLEVTYVRNITDIDDKIIRRAQEKGEDFHELAARFIEAMHEDTQALGVQIPDREPRATEAIDAMQVMIQTLLDKGFAYVAENGDVYYDVSRFEHYGELANKKLEDLRAGARVEVEESKQDPLDFVLWKTAKPNEPSWLSPWGPGRPGWHIECSAMSCRCLGSHFDIHGGGMDLKFPHHDNEIAQSETASGQKFVNYWMHNGFVQIDNEKMSKSLGNFFTVREVLDYSPPEVIRFFIISSHYRSPLNYSEENLDHAKAALEGLYIALRGLPLPVEAPLDTVYATRFYAAMDDDFNTPEALAVLFDLAREINRMCSKNKAQAARLGTSLRQLGAILGILQQNPDEFLQAPPRGAEVTLTGHTMKIEGGELSIKSPLTSEKIEQLIAQRSEARNNKNWAEADRIRDQLASQGIILEDSPDGTTWRRG
jgi:cysteinyl-tRNA synthetase